MRVSVIGSGRIGGNIGKLLAKAGHEVFFSFSRDPGKLEALAAEAGNGARSGSPQEAADFGEVVVLSVPWTMVDEALEAAGPLRDKILVDTTNPFGTDGLIELGENSSEYNARRTPNARLVKAYNTLTAGFQAEAAGKTDENRVAMFYAGEDSEAKSIVASLIEDSGFEPVDIGGWEEVWILEAPRRDGAVYGEEYHPADARKIAEALQSGDREEARKLARERSVGE